MPVPARPRYAITRGDSSLQQAPPTSRYRLFGDKRNQASVEGFFLKLPWHLTRIDM